MDFDSHVIAVSTAAAGLVNALSPGQERGRRYEAPDEAHQREIIADVLFSEAAGRPTVGAEDLAAFAGLAATLRLVFEQVEAGDLSEAAGVVNRLMRETGARPQLDSHRPGEWSMHFHGSDDSLVVGWAAGCATGLALAIGSDFAGRVGVCVAKRCDRVYVDTSRNHAKRFCSTACQSRTKAAAFRARRR